MKRSIKNIVVIILILLLSVSLGLTIDYIKDNNNVTSNSPSMNGGNPPDMSNNSDNSGSNNNIPPEMPKNDNLSKMNNNIEWYYYVLVASLSIGVSILVIYLIMSNLNKKDIKETFSSKDKIVIYVLSTILLSGILTGGSLILSDKLASNNNVENNAGGMNNNGSGNITYNASKEITSDEDLIDGKYTSTSSDENVISVSNSKSTISGVTVNNTGDSDGGDNTGFYGTNSAILAKDGAVVTIKNANITTNATGSNGVFSYGGSATTQASSGDGTTINISDSTIVTKKDNSGGIMTTGGGIMNATNLKVTTSGVSSAAIRSDRGGGIVTVNKGTYKTTGAGSPSIYSTANITVNDAKLISTASEGIVIEGKNLVTINNIELEDTNNKLNGQSTTYKNIFLYQSMSGDADTGESVFTAKNSKITTNKGDTLYVTNTTSTINLENNTIVNNDSTGYFLRIQKDSWGSSGSNGGSVKLNLTNQEVSGNIYVDELSTLEINMDASSFIGYINNENTAKSIKLVLSKDSKVTLTKDTYITSLDNEDSTNSNIDLNGYKLYVNGKSI